MSRVWSGSSGSSGARYHKPLIILLLLVIFLGYWLFAWQLERLSEVYHLPGWWDTMVAAYPLLDILSPVLSILLQMLSPRVLRHMIPVIAGVVMARIVVGRFLESFYDLPDGAAARALLARLTASDNATRPKLAVTPNSMAMESRHTLLHVGGPGSVSVGRGYALVTEQNGHFKRVMGPGSYILARFEHPHSLVDVRPQERETEAIYAATSDGIELQIVIGMIFQISQGSKSPTKEQSFPFDEEAVKLAAYGQTVLGSEEVAKWEDLVVIIITRELRELIAQSRLDDLILSERIGIHPHPRLTSELKRRAQGVLLELGVSVRDIRMGRFELPDPIIEQNIRQWQTYWQEQQTIRESMGEEISVQESDQAWIRAEATFVKEIAAAVEQVQSELGPTAGKKDLALQLTASLERLALQSEEVTGLPEHLLGKIDSFRQEIERDGG